MSRWVERIVSAFPTEIARFWIAVDPDGVLLDERVLSTLRARGFELLPFEDSVAFRVDYEERYRAAWDRGEVGPSLALILHLREPSGDALPWDYLRQGRPVRLGLADLFPKLSYNVVRQIGADHLEAVFDAQAKHAAQPLGEALTKDFILLHIFGLAPQLISRPVALWRELLALHYRDMVLPRILANHVADVIGGHGAFEGLPIADLFSSKGVFTRVVQTAWSRYLAGHGLIDGRPGEARAPDRDVTAAIPFDHPDIRVIVDSMFLDGTLHPVAVEGDLGKLPEWAKVGVVEDPNALANLVAEGGRRIAEALPGLDAHHREWSQLSRRLGEVLYRLHALAPVAVEPLRVEILDLQKAADLRLREWLARHYADLPSLPPAKGPVMVHHVPRFLALRRAAGEDRVALLVFDGLAMDQWIQIREHLAEAAPAFAFEENACFAWAPTLTSVSRQALFSGSRPWEFAGSIETTAQELSLWSRFWLNNGLRAHEVLYRKSLKRVDQLPDVEAVVGASAVKVAAIVVDTVDEIVHGAVLGKRGIASQIASWCASGFVERLFGLLLDHGFSVYLTADHGNVDAVGIGRLNQGVASEMRGERVRTYRSEALAASTPPEIDAFRLDIAGLPADFLPLFAGGRGAFVPKGERIVGHGGISVEELLVPFVKVSKASTV